MPPNLTPNFVPTMMLVLLVLVFPTTLAFVSLSTTTTPTHAPKQQSFASSSRLYVRNIDLPECVVLYGVYDDDVWGNLIQQCIELDTAVIVIGSSKDTSTKSKHENKIHFYTQTCTPPNPKDLLQALALTDIQPRPFGGSSGFGASRILEPRRTPLAQRTVVFCETLAQTQAARVCGMRVICLTDNPLCDATLANDDEIRDLWLEDIATPGSFWLNPPHPRDDEGNAVNPEKVVEWFEMQQQQETTSSSGATSATTGEEDELSQEELDRILADLDPL